MSTYQERIRETLARNGFIGVDPRHIEAYMRVECPTLDGLSGKRFDALAIDCVADVKADPQTAERLAQMDGI